MDLHKIVTIIFGVCFLATAAISIPLSHVVYISASITMVFHYLFVQYLVNRVPTLLAILCQYMMCAIMSTIAGITWFLINYTPQEWNDQMNASLGFVIVHGLGLLIFLMFGIFGDRYINDL